MNHLASCSPHVLECNNSLNKQQSSLQATGRKAVQFKLEFELHKLIEPLKITLPDLFANDLYIADNLTQPTTLLHNDDITSDDVTGIAGSDLMGDTKSHATHDDGDVMLNSKGESPVINANKDDHSQEELTGDSNRETLDSMKESLTDNDLPTISTDLQQDTTMI